MTRMILRAAGLTVSYGVGQRKRRALDAVDLDIERGEVLAVVGESGSGKSTLARSLIGMTVAAGSIELDGETVTASAASRTLQQRQKIGMVFQSSSVAFNPRHSVEAILNEPLRLLGSRGAFTSATELLNMVGLPPALLRRYPWELSGGQRQRVGIARALAVSPDLLICDEAVSALDVSVQAQILNLLTDLQHQVGLSILFISHDLSVVSYIADRIAVMRDGKIVESGLADHVLDRATHEYTRRLLDASL